MNDQTPFQWSVPGEALQFSVAPTAIEQIGRDLAARGEHSRGLLLGAWIDDAGEQRCVVSDCLPLGEPDNSRHDLLSCCREMESILEAWRNTPNMPAPVGAYLHSGGNVEEFCRTELSKIEKYLSGRTDFALCVNAADDGIAGEVIAVKHSIGIIARTPFTKGTIHPAATNHYEATDIRSEFRAAAARTSEGPRLITVPEPVKPKAGRHRFLRRSASAGTAGGFVILIAAGLWWASHSPGPGATAQGQAPGDIGLRVIRKGGELEITWNTNSPSARAAHTAVMRVKDGSRETELPLDAKERKNGHIVYSPRSGDVDVRVEFMSAGKTVGAGSVRVLNALQGKSPEPAPAVKSAAEPRVASTNARLSPFAPKSQKPKSAVPETQRARASVPPPVRSVRPATVAERPNPPENTPPVPLENAPVSVPANLRAAITADITIPVHVTVDEHGRVTDARVNPVRDAVGSELAAIALEAAKRWQFKPATRGGEPVSSPYILNFRFRR